MCMSFTQLSCFLDTNIYITMIWYEIMQTVLDDTKQQNTSWKANSPSASNEIPRILWNPTVYYHFHNTSPLVLTLSHMIQSTVFHYISLRSILILHSHLKSGLLLGSPTNVVYAFPFAFIRATCSAHLIPFCLIVPITFGVKHKPNPTYLSKFLLSFPFNPYLANVENKVSS